MDQLTLSTTNFQIKNAVHGHEMWSFIVRTPKLSPKVRYDEILHLGVWTARHISSDGIRLLHDNTSDDRNTLQDSQSNDRWLTCKHIYWLIAICTLNWNWTHCLHFNLRSNSERQWSLADLVVSDSRLFWWTAKSTTFHCLGRLLLSSFVFHSRCTAFYFWSWRRCTATHQGMARKLKFNDESRQLDRWSFVS